VNRAMGDRIVYINVMNRLSIDCDCDPNPHEPDMHDIGILVSTDPLAIDQAAIDLVYAMPDSGSLIRRIESLNGLHTLDAAEAIGLGSRTYQLVIIR
ncbi:MAG: ferredoxin, partial [Clostridia bacterium]|nr:ferredoxin [Clostridia bacterium]